MTFNKPKREVRYEKQKTIFFLVLAMLLVLGGTALAKDKPNILVIMTDDVGMWNVSAYHRGMMGGRSKRGASPV
jgi:arylsulfatase